MITGTLKRLEIIKNVLCKNCYVVGDFNLDVGMSNRPDYSNKHTLEKLDNFVNSENLIQIVNFDTWSRIVNGIKKSSLLDHIYVLNPATVLDISHYLPPFGDHLLVTAKLIFKVDVKEKTCGLRRD